MPSPRRIIDTIQTNATARSFSGDGKVIPIVLCKTPTIPPNILWRHESARDPQSEEYHYDVYCNHSDHYSSKPSTNV